MAFILKKIKRKLDVQLILKISSICIIFLHFNAYRRQWSPNYDPVAAREQVFTCPPKNRNNLIICVISKTVIKYIIKKYLVQ